jgi:hypothetical protein
MNEAVVDKDVQCTSISITVENESPKAYSDYILPTYPMAENNVKYALSEIYLDACSRNDFGINESESTVTTNSSESLNTLGNYNNSAKSRKSLPRLLHSVKNDNNQVLTVPVSVKSSQKSSTSNSESSISSSYQDLNDAVESVKAVMSENICKLYERTENLSNLEAKAKNLTEQVSVLSTTTNRISRKVINKKITQMRQLICLLIMLVVCLCLTSSLAFVYGDTNTKIISAN